MKRSLVVVTGALLGLLALLPGAGWASHNADVHTPNMSLLANFDDGGKALDGSDLAFWGSTAVLPNYNSLRLVDISDPFAPRELGELACPGAQADVTVWKDLVFMSVDSPRSGPQCGAGGAPLAQQEQGTDWEGIRIISIADPSKPEQIHTVRTGCGSHTNTLVPDEANGRLLIYVNSYPTVGIRSPTCNDATHEQLSVIEVPLADPRAAKVVSTPKITAGPNSPSNGCHDVTVFLPKKIAAAACLQETQVWDIADPVNPKVLTTFKNPQIQFDHSTEFSNDGNTLIIGDEFAGAAAPHSCATGTEPFKFGALWFYDVADPKKLPVQKGSFQLERQGPLALCTAHNFNTVPLRSDRDILVSAFYEGGTAVIDYTDPSKPTKIGGYIPKTKVSTDAWSSYWYDGLIYVNNHEGAAPGASGSPTAGTQPASRGLDIKRFEDPAVADAIKLGHLNPQTHEAFPPPPSPGAPGPARQGVGGSVGGPADCVGRSTTVVPRRIGAFRVGMRRPSVIRFAGLGIRPNFYNLRYCAKGGGHVLVSFGRHNRVRLIASTSPGARTRKVGPGSSIRQLLRAYPTARKERSGVYVVRRRGRGLLAFGTRGRRVDFVAVGDRKVLSRRRTALMRHHVRRIRCSEGGPGLRC